jgi:hypothetical protein
VQRRGKAEQYQTSVIGCASMRMGPQSRAGTQSCYTDRRVVQSHHFQSNMAHDPSCFSLLMLHGLYYLPHQYGPDAKSAKHSPIKSHHIADMGMCAGNTQGGKLCIISLEIDRDGFLWMEVGEIGT